MKLVATALASAFIVESEPQTDARGHFARTFDDQVLASVGISFVTRQCSVSFNKQRGTLRGMHYQLQPAAETKLVRCTRGAVFDVVIDLRRDSRTFKRWVGTELSDANLRAMLVPRGCAHGFITLADASEVLYQIDAAYAPDLTRGVRWNDPAFGVAWPLAPAVIAPRDAAFPDFAGPLPDSP